jgi:hypothetical protein
MGLVLLLLLLVDNLYFNYSGLKIRVSEFVGIVIYSKLLFRNFIFNNEIKYPPATIYFIIFIIASSISMIGIPPIPFKEGIVFQLHILILFISSVAIYNKLLTVNLSQVENKIFIIADCILLYAFIQILFYYIFNYNLTFGMGEWADRSLPLSYRQDFIDPKSTTSFYENSPWLRPPSIFAEPVFFGLFCTWVLIISAIKITKCHRLEKKKWTIRVIAAFIMSIFIASRALWIACSIVLSYFFFIHESKQRVKKLVILIMSILGIIIFTNLIFGSLIIEGIVEGRFNIDFIQSDLRSIFWLEQINGFLTSPLIGHGRGMTHDLIIAILPEQMDAQAVGGYSFWVTLLYDTGILGFITFIIFVIKSLREKSKIIYSDNQETNPYNYGIVGMLGFGLLLGPMLNCGTFWFTMVVLWLSKSKCT